MGPTDVAADRVLRDLLKLARIKVDGEELRPGETVTVSYGPHEDMVASVILTATITIKGAPR